MVESDSGGQLLRDVDDARRDVAVLRAGVVAVLRTGVVAVLRRGRRGFIAVDINGHESDIRSCRLFHHFLFFVVFLPVEDSEKTF